MNEKYKKLEALLIEMQKSIIAHGLPPAREFHVNPQDDILKDYRKIAGLTVVSDYGVPNGKWYLIQ